MSQVLFIAENAGAAPGDRLEELIRAAVAGDRAALEDVLMAVERRVYIFAWRLIGNPTAAEDITQEVLLKLAGNLARYRQGTHLWAWICRIVINQVHDHRRRDRALPEVAPETRAFDPHRHEQLQRVEEAMAILTCKEREAVLLLDVEGYTSREAAVILGTLAITVRTRAAHARMKLRRHLSWYYPELKESP